MGRPGLNSKPRSAADSPVGRAAPQSPVSSPGRKKIVVIAAGPVEELPPVPTQGTSDPDSGDRPHSQAYGDPDAQGLSQLSDLADLGSDPGPGVSRGNSQFKPPTASQMAMGSQSQEDVQVDIGSTLPSQPDIPVPETVPDGPPPAAEPTPAEGQYLAAPRLPHPTDDEQGERVKRLIDSIRNPAQPMVPQYTYVGAPRLGSGANSGEEELVLHPKSRAARRGPMDEMRQLVRILVKVIPQSMPMVAAGPEGGGNNRISEEQIKSYLSSTLGPQAPYPQWGVPQGWGAYLSELLTWATGREISKADAMRCARREPGRSWQAIPSELTRLGVHPEKWELPLSLEKLRGVVAPLPAVAFPGGGAAKRLYDTDIGLTPPAQLPAKRRATGSGDLKPTPSRSALVAAQLEGCSEIELWQHIAEAARMAHRLSGTTAQRDQQMLQAAQLEARMAVNTSAGGSIAVPSSELPIAGLEAGPSVSMPGLSGMAGTPPPGVTPDHIKCDSKTGQEMQMDVKHVQQDGKHFAMMPRDQVATFLQTISNFNAQHVAAMAAHQQGQPAQTHNASLNLLQNTNLTGSLGPIPGTFGTESQSHISPHAMPDTQASQGFQDAAAALADAKPSGETSPARRTSFHNHPDLKVGNEKVTTAGLVPSSQGQGMSTESVVLYNPKDKLPCNGARMANASSSGAPPAMPASQCFIASQASAGGVLPQRHVTAPAPRPSPLST